MLNIALNLSFPWRPRLSFSMRCSVGREEEGKSCAISLIAREREEGKGRRICAGSLSSSCLLTLLRFAATTTIRRASEKKEFDRTDMDTVVPHKK